MEFFALIFYNIPVILVVAFIARLAIDDLDSKPGPPPPSINYEQSPEYFNSMAYVASHAALQEAAQATEDNRNAEIVRECTERFRRQQAQEAEERRQREAIQLAEEQARRARLARPSEAFYRWLRG